MSRMLDRGETLAAIAELAGVKVSDVRAVLKSAGAQTGRAAGCTRRAQRRGRQRGRRGGERRVGRGWGVADTRCRWARLA